MSSFKSLPTGALGSKGNRFCISVAHLAWRNIAKFITRAISYFTVERSCTVVLNPRNQPRDVPAGSVGSSFKSEYQAHFYPKLDALMQITFLLWVTVVLLARRGQTLAMDLPVLTLMMVLLMVYWLYNIYDANTGIHKCCMTPKPTEILETFSNRSDAQVDHLTREITGGHWSHTHKGLRVIGVKNKFCYSLISTILKKKNPLSSLCATSLLSFTAKIHERLVYT